MAKIKYNKPSQSSRLIFLIDLQKNFIFGFSLKFKSPFSALPSTWLNFFYNLSLSISAFANLVLCLLIITEQKKWISQMNGYRLWSDKTWL